nr:hypothetical protein [Tanacetum cinerariifolium]
MMLVMMVMVSRKRICTSYGLMKVIGSSLLSLYLRDQVTWRVEYAWPYGIIEYDEVILVSDGSEALNSSSVGGKTGVGSDEVGLWSDDGGAVLAASG